MFNNLEIIGNFMHPADAYLPLHSWQLAGSISRGS